MYAHAWWALLSTIPDKLEDWWRKTEKEQPCHCACVRVHVCTEMSKRGSMGLNEDCRPDVVRIPQNDLNQSPSSIPYLKLSAVGTLTRIPHTHTHILGYLMVLGCKDTWHVDAFWTSQRGSPSASSWVVTTNTSFKRKTLPMLLHRGEQKNDTSTQIISFFMISKCWTEPPVNQREIKLNKPKETLKNMFFFIFHFSSPKNNAQLVPQDLKKLSDKNFKILVLYCVYIYIYIYIICTFSSVQTAAVW